MVAPPLLHRAPPEAGVHSSCSWCLYLCLPPGHLCGYLLHVWVSPPAFGTRELDPTQACQEGSPARSQPSFWVKRWVGGAWANDLVLGICWAPSKRGTADGLLGVSGPQTNPSGDSEGIPGVVWELQHHQHHSDRLDSSRVGPSPAGSPQWFCS